MAKSKSDVQEQVEKILRKAESTSQHEAEVAMALAHRLMVQHGITMSDIEGLKKDAQATTDKTYTKGNKDAYSRGAEFPWWEQKLAQGVAEMTDTFRFYRRRINPKTGALRVYLVFVGDQLDVAIALATYRMLFYTCRGLVQKRYGTTWTVESRSFSEGFASAIIERAQELNRRAHDNYDGTANASEFALVRESKRDWLQRILIAEGLIEDPAVVEARMARWREEEAKRKEALAKNPPPAPTVPAKPARAKKWKQTGPRTNWDAFDSGHDAGHRADTNVRDKMG